MRYDVPLWSGIILMNISTFHDYYLGSILWALFILLMMIATHKDYLLEKKIMEMKFK